MNEDQLIAIFEQHGIRPTANRILVARCLAEATRPLSLFELTETLATLDKSSIFRTLTLFRQQHLVHVLEDGSDGVRYELCHSCNHQEDNDMHVHFHCERCGQTLCLEDLPVPEITLPEGYLTESANFMLKGICPKCRK